MEFWSWGVWLFFFLESLELWSGAVPNRALVVTLLNLINPCAVSNIKLN
uniref:Uncharacterized protein n=1 Tax=Setaria viridis TaxID=4556 RepID=A0A4V6Y8P4_SETVI|nr:hypothetical protein SEVIR_3G242766v2 [Setaria viridis]